MSETKHSPEPWREAGDGNVNVLDAEEGRCAEAWGGSHLNQSVCEANARRIAACVNACAGIPTEALEAGKLAVLLSELTAQLAVGFDRRRIENLLRALGRLP